MVRVGVSVRERLGGVGRVHGRLVLEVRPFFGDFRHACKQSSGRLCGRGSFLRTPVEEAHAVLGLVLRKHLDDEDEEGGEERRDEALEDEHLVACEARPVHAEVQHHGQGQDVDEVREEGHDQRLLAVPAGHPEEETPDEVVSEVDHLEQLPEAQRFELHDFECFATQGVFVEQTLELLDEGVLLALVDGRRLLRP